VVIDTTPPWFRHSATTRDTYVACKGITVTWSAEDEQEIVENLVEFSSNGGRTWTTIDTLFGHPDSISWTLPKIFSDSCYVRIICDDYWHNSSQSTSERFRIINEPPTQPVLMGPPDSLHLYTAGTWFDWSNSTDAPCDTVRYYIRIWSSILDTTVGPLAKPPIYFNGIRWFRKDTTYYWTVLATDGRDTSWGTQGVWRFFVADTLLPVCPDAEVPLKFALSQNYPNPFNSSTTIRYDLPHKSTVQLVVYNTLGQQVATLVHREKEAGFHEVKFDGTGLSTGVYLYRIQAGDFVQTLKLLLLR
jgi:hypothetical protein